MQKQNPKTPSDARQYAIDWQNWQSEQSMSYSELIEWQNHFRAIASKFGLYDEFIENSII